MLTTSFCWIASLLVPQAPALALRLREGAGLTTLGRRLCKAGLLFDCLASCGSMGSADSSCFPQSVSSKSVAVNICPGVSPRVPGARVGSFVSLSRPVLLSRSSSSPAPVFPPTSSRATSTLSLRFFGISFFFLPNVSKADPGLTWPAPRSVPPGLLNCSTPMSRKAFGAARAFFLDGAVYSVRGGLEPVL